jgi:hypothetical protein
MRNNAMTFHAPNAQDALHDPQIPPDEKHKFGLTCLGAPFMEIALGPHEHEKLVHQQFAPWMHCNAILHPQIPPDAKTQVQHNVCRHAFYENRIGPT